MVIVCVFAIALKYEITDSKTATENECNSEEAVEYDIWLKVVSGTGNNRIRIYYEDSEAYFFIPSGCEVSSLQIQHELTELYIDGKKYRSNDQLVNIEIGTTYEACIYDESGNSVKEFNVVFVQSDNIGALFIETDESMDLINESKENTTSGYFWCLNEKGGMDSLGKISRLKGRGQTSFATNKKGYSIKLDEKKNILSIGKTKTWILISNVMDKTRLRNKASEQLASLLGIETSVRMEYVDLYFNGEYYGNYLICEKPLEKLKRIKTDDKNYAVIEAMPAYELEVGKEYFTDYLFEEQSEGGIKNQIEYPESVSEEDKQIIEDKFITVEKKILECTSEDDYVELLELIDEESFVNMFIMDFITWEKDANTVSTFYYYNENSGKVHAGLPWDFDRSMGNAIESERYIGLNSYFSGLPEVLFENPYFREAVKEKLDGYEGTIYEELLNDFDWYRAEIAKSVEMESIIYGERDMSLSAGMDYDTDCKWARSCIEERGKLLYDLVYNWDDYNKIHLENRVTGKVLFIKKGETISGELIDYICQYVCPGQCLITTGGVVVDENTVLEDNEVLKASNLSQ